MRLFCMFLVMKDKSQARKTERYATKERGHRKEKRCGGLKFQA